MISRDLFNAPGPLLLAPEWLLLPEGARQGMAVLVEDGRFTAVGSLADVLAAHPGLAPRRQAGTDSKAAHRRSRTR